MSTDRDQGTLISPGEGERAPTQEATESARKSSKSPEAFDEGGLSRDELLHGRFRIEELIQSGGMGDVYRAFDMLEKKPVAVKTLRAGSTSVARFEREAQRLSELKDPGIPRYITHNLAAGNRPYLVMEWLEGLDLASLLRKRSVSVKNAVELVVQIAKPLQTAHARGVIHRDLNPSNVFLVGGALDEVKILDFGVARLQEEGTRLTAEGTQIGTPGYMAPEQVEGSAEVGPPADVFALGCILHEVVSGQRAFYAPTIRELLSRIVAEDPIALIELNPGVPPQLSELVSKMLSKDPASRPSDAANTLALLRALPPIEELPASDVRPSMPAMSVQQVSSVIVMRVEDPTVFERAARAAEPHGLRARRGTDGTIVIATSGKGTAGDHAAQASRCALAVQKATRVTQIAVSTGLSQIGGEALSGRAFDSALVSLLLKEGADDYGGPCLWLDDNTAALLDSRFEVRAVEQGFLLRGIRSTYEPARTVLGRRTRCVGRKRELTMLEATLEEAFEERVASSVLITGAPGSGKTRLAAEVCRTARRKVAGVEILRADSDSLAAGAPYFGLSRAISRVCRIGENEPENVRRQKLHDRLKEVMPDDEFSRVAEFLGELLGISGDREVSLQLEAARRDAVLRGDQIQRAMEDWLRAESIARPIVLVLDDFHWGDLATAKFVDRILRNLSECRLVVLALGRPEVHELFPKLWARRGVTELRLGGLSRRAVVEMVKEVLGDDVAPEILDRVIARAQGNPFWIEELLRAEDAGQGENVPDRVVLLAQSRIEQQSIDERRLLGAASVFGRMFWLGGAAAVLGPEEMGRSASLITRDLVEAEFITEHELSRLGGEQEFEFASGLLRDAAYSLLDDQEREDAHSRAALWLERNGEADPLAVAMHFSLGGEVDRARPHYLAAAEQALAGDDLQSAVSCAEEGLSTGARGLDAVRLRLVHAEASKWRGDNALAFRSAQAAFARAEEATPEWFRAAGEAAVAAGKLGKSESSLALAKELSESENPREATAERGIALARVATQLVLLGHGEMASTLLDAIGHEDALIQPDPRVMGFVQEARAQLAGAGDDAEGRIRHADQGVSYFEDAGDMRNACLLRLSQGFAELEFGANEDALRTLREALATAERMGLDNSLPVARAQIGRALSRTGHLDEGLEHLTEAGAQFDRQKNLRLAGMCRVYLAEAHLISANPDAALEALERAEGILQSMPPLLRIAQAMLAAVYAKLDEPEVALSWAEKALDGVNAETRLPVSESLVRLGAAIGLLSGGESERAREILGAEMGRVRSLTSTMTSERAEQFSEGCPSRKLVLAIGRDGALLGSTLGYFEHLASLASARQPVASDESWTEPLNQAVLRLESASTAEQFSRFSAEQAKELAGAVATVVDQRNANWLAFLEAGANAELNDRHDEALLESELGRFPSEAPPLVPEVAGVLRVLVSLFGLSAAIASVGSEALREEMAAFRETRRHHFAGLVPYISSFVTRLGSGPSESEFEGYLQSLPPGTPESGGLGLLGRGFSAWFDASRADTESGRAQAVLRGNCYLALHDQTLGELQLLRSLEPQQFEERLQAKVSRVFPGWVRFLFGKTILRGLRPFRSRLNGILERTLRPLLVCEALPSRSWLTTEPDSNRPPVPPTLAEIRDPKTEAILDRFDSELAVLPAAGDSGDWSLQKRMSLLVGILRRYQEALAPEQSDDAQSGRD